MKKSKLTPSLKQRCEQQIIAEICSDPAVRALLPRFQDQDGRPKKPYVAVVASPGQEISPGANLSEIPVAVEFYFDSKREGQSGAGLDDVVNRADIALSLAQARGDYGMIKNGEQATQFVDDTTRKRILSLTLIAG